MTIVEVARDHHGRCFRTGDLICRFWPNENNPDIEYWQYFNDGEWLPIAPISVHLIRRESFKWCGDPSDYNEYPLTVAEALEAHLAGQRVESNIPQLGSLKAALSHLNYGERDYKLLRCSRWRIVKENQQ